MALLVRYFVRKFALRMNRHIETVPKETIKALSNGRGRATFENSRT